MCLSCPPLITTGDQQPRTKSKLAVKGHTAGNEQVKKISKKLNFSVEGHYSLVESLIRILTKTNHDCHSIQGKGKHRAISLLSYHIHLVQKTSELIHGFFCCY